MNQQWINETITCEEDWSQNLSSLEARHSRGDAILIGWKKDVWEEPDVRCSVTSVEGHTLAGGGGGRSWQRRWCYCDGRKLMRAPEESALQTLPLKTEGCYCHNVIIDTEGSVAIVVYDSTAVYDSKPKGIRLVRCPQPLSILTPSLHLQQHYRITLQGCQKVACSIPQCQHIVPEGIQ